MKNAIINIPDMQSAHCQARVNNAVQAIEKVQVIKTEPGKIEVSVENDNLHEVVKAIEKAGYTVASSN